MNMLTLNQILENIPALRIGLIGDGCVDIYWEADMRLSELSREVPQHPLPIINERFSLGAGANVLANLAALGAKNIQYVGCVGCDWRGVIFKRLLEQIAVSSDYLVTSDGIITPAYCKPIRHGISPVTVEDPRIDFINREPFSKELEDRILSSLRTVAQSCDILIVCDQFANGCISNRVIEEVNALGVKMPVIVDSRDRGSCYKNAIVKPNEVEACATLGLDPDFISQPSAAEHIARALEKRNGRPALITLGAQGAMWCENGKCTTVPAVPVSPPIDFVGAGDSFLAGFSLAYVQKFSPEDALNFASLVSAITIKKIGTTGVATPEEMRSALEHYAEVWIPSGTPEKVTV